MVDVVVAWVAVRAVVPVVRVGRVRVSAPVPRLKVGVAGCSSTARHTRQKPVTVLQDEIATLASGWLVDLFYLVGLKYL